MNNPRTIDQKSERDVDKNIENAEKFWEDLHVGHPTQPLDAQPSAVLAAVVTGSGAGLTVGDALDMGSAEGADTVWLGQRGWSVLGVDVSTTVLKRTRVRAEHASVSVRVRTERHDLALMGNVSDSFS
jgi:2-polyprenyl-3-methyl-5-hydroxy-6-metoxy-1,4-benzoquinol methylase